MKDITFLIPSMNGGGAEKVTMLLANELCIRGWKVKMLLSKKEGPYLSKLHPNISIQVLKHRNISKNIFQIASFLRKEKPSIFYSSMMYVNVIAGLSAKLAKFEGALFFSDHSHVSSTILRNKSKVVKIIFFLAKYIYRRANEVICVSEGVKTDLQKLITGVHRISVINNPIELHNFQTKALDKEQSLKKIISIGRLDRDKNFKLLIDCFAELVKEVKDIRLELTILGEGYERNNLINQINELGLSNQVFLPGFVNNTTSYLQNADIFAFTSVREGFGNVLVEALSVGLPVISADCESGPAEILLNGKIGKLVPINDLEKLKKAILEEIYHPNFTSTVEERISRANFFSVKNIVNKYETLLLEYI